MQAFDAEIMSAFLTPEKVAEIGDKLFHSSDSNARIVGTYLEDSLPAGYLKDAGLNLPIQIFAAAAPDPKHILDSAVRVATNGGKSIAAKTYTDNFRNAKNWGLALLQKFFFEVRQKLCGKGKKPPALGDAANAALASLTTAVCTNLGLSHLLGSGIAVLIILNVARIGKTALCNMTSPEELAKYF